MQRYLYIGSRSADHTHNLSGAIPAFNLFRQFGAPASGFNRRYRIPEQNPLKHITTRHTKDEFVSSDARGPRLCVFQSRIASYELQILALVLVIDLRSRARPEVSADNRERSNVGTQHYT